MSKHPNDILLSGYMDGTLPSSTMHEVKSHLETCPGCTARLEQIKCVSAMLRELPMEEPPAGLKERIMAGIQGEADKANRRMHRINTHLRTAIAAAAAVVVAAAGLTLGLGGGPSAIREGMDQPWETHTDAFKTANTASSGLGATPAELSWEDGASFYETEARSEEVGYYEDYPMEEPAAAAPLLPPDPGYVSSEDIPEPRSGAPEMVDIQKIIYTAHCTQETYTFEADHKAILEEAARLGGFAEYNTVSGKSYDKGGYGLTASLHLRVPQPHYGDMMAFLSGVGTQSYLEESSENISQVYSNENIRLKNLQEQHAALLELLDKAESLDDVLLLQSELNDIATRIEQSQSYLRNMDHDVNYSSIYVELSEMRPVDTLPVSAEKLTLGERMKESLYRNLAGLRDDSQNFLVWLVGAAPVLAILAVIAVIVLWILLRVRKKKLAQR